jgi:hypothetical protein
MPYSYAHYLSAFVPVRLHPLPFAYEPIPIKMYWRAQAMHEPYMLWLTAYIGDTINKVLPHYQL